jgi:hypothetical protein
MMMGVQSWQPTVVAGAAQTMEAHASSVGQHVSLGARRKHPLNIGESVLKRRLVVEWPICKTAASSIGDNMLLAWLVFH